eukprot:TRINITY_DN56921_c0_g1_i1.p1 TRINITY_DN56921_c0_g1~~TRINITY_DN56921_c0_g1_i1.p1  ORF type:complete len:339 (+),score=71.14 TRINITY_DN56921_c0_g1_i1:34-1050(+)
MKECLCSSLVLSCMASYHASWRAEAPAAAGRRFVAPVCEHHEDVEDDEARSEASSDDLARPGSRSPNRRLVPVSLEVVSSHLWRALGPPRKAAGSLELPHSSADCTSTGKSAKGGSARLLSSGTWGSSTKAGSRSTLLQSGPAFSCQLLVSDSADSDPEEREEYWTEVAEEATALLAAAAARSSLGAAAKRAEDEDAAPAEQDADDAEALTVHSSDCSEAAKSPACAAAACLTPTTPVPAAAKERRRGLDEVLQIFEASGRGSLDPCDLKLALHWLGLEAKDDDVRALMQRYGRLQRGAIACRCKDLPQIVAALSGMDGDDMFCPNGEAADDAPQVFW